MGGGAGGEVGREDCAAAGGGGAVTTSRGGCAAFAGGAAALPCLPASTAPITSPTVTVAPAANRCSLSAPATGDGNCTVILSVSSSATGSSTVTASPTFLSQHETTASEIDSPNCGTTRS